MRHKPEIDALEQTKTSCCCWEKNHDPLVPEPITQYYTDCAENCNGDETFRCENKIHFSAGDVEDLNL